MSTTFRFGRAVALVVAAMFAAPLSAFAGPLSSWDKVITDGGQRFVVLTDFGDQAVLDNETNLVWERSPSTGIRNWSQAVTHCYNNIVGSNTAAPGRLGWRLPTIEELQSLINPIPQMPGTPLLTPGHPFEGIDSTYWSATTTTFPVLGEPGAWTRVFVLSQRSGQGLGQAQGRKKSSKNRAWCVRGGQGQDSGL